METLETKRLILRQFYLSDIDDFYEYCKNPNVGPNAGWKPHESKEESMEILSNFIKQNEVWAIVKKDENKVIGSIGLHRDYKREFKNVKMIGYVLSEKHWGKGYATEAAKRVIQYGFETLNLDMISVYHYSNNIRSKRVIEKCGFKYEGTLRNSSILYDGSIFDDLCYSLTRSEYYEKYNKNFMR